MSRARNQRGEPVGSEDDALPLERVIHIAEFRAGLRRFLRRSERTSRTWGLTPQRYVLLLSIKGAPDGASQRSTIIASFISG